MLVKPNSQSKATRALEWPHNVEGREDNVCFKKVVEYIINEKLQSFKNSIEDKAEWVVQTVAKIVIVWNFRKKSYPTNRRCFIYYQQQWGFSLLYFLKHLIIS